MPLPELILAPPADGDVPDEQACRQLWRRFDMLPNVESHSLKVAEVALALAERAVALGGRDVREATRASALLHDIAKTYTIRYGGSHAQLGASWVMTHVGNPLIAQAVFHHVWWPWSLPGDLALPVFLVFYADKRVKHDSVVDIETRFVDLLDRYGKNEASRAHILAGHEMSRTVERALSAFLEMPLHACTLAGGRLVERT
jgi:putative nucleotidyltransferase with HDIG domain